MDSLRIARLQRRVTQFRLQVLTGIPQCRISTIENGYVDPRPDEKKKLAAALGMDADEIEWNAEKQSD